MFWVQQVLILQVHQVEKIAATMDKDCMANIHDTTLIRDQNWLRSQLLHCWRMFLQFECVWIYTLNIQLYWRRNKNSKGDHKFTRKSSPR